MILLSTRDKSIREDALKSVLLGIARDGGLFVPESFPQISKEKLLGFSDKGYEEISAEVLGMYFDNLGFEEIYDIVKKGYAGFDNGKAAPLKKLKDNEYILELWHGPTLAFKDMALQVMPGLLAAAKRCFGESKKTLILVATSGDTGKAALTGFKDKEGIEIIVFYPDDGVSNMQKLQMDTQEGKNTHVAAILGNFDDAQSGVKEIFADADFRRELSGKGYALSSANSINFGRLIPQTAYYISAYAQLLKTGGISFGEKINIAVPTGNFGNILAAYYAKMMGLPVKKLICASNKNNVLTDFFISGEYKSSRPFYKTSSPSMDILISSNLERLLFEMTGRDEKKVAGWMRALKDKGVYNIDDGTLENVKEHFYAGWSGEKRVFNTIKKVFEESGYLMDPHTAVAQAVYEEYTEKTKDDAKTVAVSTASPYKFCADVLLALEVDIAGRDDFGLIGLLNEKSGAAVPESIKELAQKPILHRLSIQKKDMKKTIKDILKI